MAREAGPSQAAVTRIWRAYGLKPHASETFELATDPSFIDKVRDAVGPYLAPPERASVLCVDEKGRVRAPDRTQPLPPRDDLAGRGVGRRDRRGDRSVSSSPPGAGVRRVPRPSGRRGSA